MDCCPQKMKEFGLFEQIQLFQQTHSYTCRAGEAALPSLSQPFPALPKAGEIWDDEEITN